MVLKELLQKIPHTLIQGSEETEITEVVCDSRKAKPGCLFVAISGSRADGCQYIPQVIEAGAAAVVAEAAVEEVAVEARAAVAYVQVEDSRAALSGLAAAWFGEPARQLRMIGITGTKGKTTTAAMVRRILEEAGHKTGLIGTNGVRIGEEHYPTVNTTPESLEIHGYLRKMADSGCDSVVMEVSSQGLMMHRVDDIFFDYGVFTNISPDHIGPGEHKDFDDYLEYKSQLLRRCRVGVVNRDDVHFAEIVKRASCRIVTFGMETPSDWMAKEVDYRTGHGFMRVAFEAVGAESFPVEVSVPGLFNVYNALAALALGETMGLEREAVVRALKTTAVDGRMEIICASPKLVALVDYAHNAVSLESLLDTLRAYRPKRLVCVFGCGGNRSKLRRYEMGEISGRKADLSIITADNSRWEKVEDIMADIRVGIGKTEGEYVAIADRREAIRYSVSHAREGDMIAVVGKGHEDYQEICGVRSHFLDREELQKALEEFGYL